MTSIVVDASALMLVVAGKGAEHDRLRTRVEQQECHAPHLVDAELGNALRRQVLAGSITEDAAREGLRAMPVLVDHRYEHLGPFAEAAWRLRGAVSFYDALYVALAAALACPLVTADARLARSPKLPCQVEVVAPR